MCAAAGVKTRATVVDHIKRHFNRIAALFFAFDNTQSLCKRCHDSDKAKEESRGYGSEIGSDGLPVDKRHPFYKT
jgi:hypothetical protein